ncbi:M16 family metallopeptidase [Elusimicrobiota bacterium]
MKKTFIFFSLLIMFARAGYAGGNVNSFTLSNGIKVLHKLNTTNPLVSVQVFINCGSLGETPEQAGIAHFTQNMMLYGTKNRTAKQIAQDTEDIGTEITGEAHSDYSSLGISMISKNFDRAVEILSDIIKNPIFPSDEIEKERSNTLASIKARKDRIFSVADDLLNETMYGNHPYSWPGVGKKETVSKFSRENIVKWHKINYVSNNMFIVTAGSISKNDLKNSLEKYFSDIEKNDISSVSHNAPEKLLKEVKKENNKFKQAYLVIGYPAPESDCQDYATLKMLNSYLGGRMSGVLFTELRENLSLAYEVGCAYPTRKEQSKFFFYIGLDKKNIGLAKDRIFKILDNLKKDPIPKKELADTKNHIKGSYLIDHQTIGKQAWYLGWWEIMGKGFKYDEKYIDDLMSVSAKDIQKCVKKYFSDKYVSVEIIPQK